MFGVVDQRPVSDILRAEEFAKAANVSRETLIRLQAYAEILRKWNHRINLVGQSTLADLWRRHMLDSAQLFPHIPPQAKTLVDFGSGAGFPGLVLSILGVPDVHLIESNGRKCAFLREAARVTAATVTIHNKRIEGMTPLNADVVTARALASLSILVQHAQPYLSPSSICLFLKGRGVEEELTELRKISNIRGNIYQSITDPEGIVLSMKVESHEPAC